MSAAGTQPPQHLPNGRPYNPVVTLNGWSLPWRMNDGWKEFHLIAEPVVREMAPGMKAKLWGYNGQSPGPTIEVVEGDRVRIFVTNKLPEHTSIHWHGQRLPNGMDGVSGLTQPAIPAGKTFVYEFAAQRPGTFMYHPHADEMVQMAMGMMGTFIVHPKDRGVMPVDRDFVFLMSAYDIDPGSFTPRVNEMTDFNMWTWNARVFPGIDPLPVRTGDRVRIRFGNLTMTNRTNSRLWRAVAAPVNRELPRVIGTSYSYDFSWLLREAKTKLEQAMNAVRPFTRRQALRASAAAMLAAGVWPGWGGAEDFGVSVCERRVEEWKSVRVKGCKS